MNNPPFEYYSPAELEIIPNLHQCELEPVDWPRLIRDIRRDATLLKHCLDKYGTGRSNRATFVKEAQDYFDSIGYDPAVDGVLRNGIHDRASELRLRLMLDLVVGGLQNKRRSMVSCKDFLYDYPGWIFTPTATHWHEHRNWEQRWYEAGESIGWKSAAQDSMVALKDSPIWKALGDGAGGYLDVTHRSYPPFAIGSDMGWADADRSTCESLGLMESQCTAACPACGGTIKVPDDLSGDIQCPHCGVVLTVDS